MNRTAGTCCALIAAALLIIGMAVFGQGCSHAPPPQPGQQQRPGMAAVLWNAARPIVIDLLHRLVDSIPGASSRPAEKTRTLQSRLLAAPVLHKVRSWNRWAGPGQRVRLGSGPDGKLLISWVTRPAGGHLTATLETADGAVLEQQQVAVGPAKYHPALLAGGHLLIRDDERLELGGSMAGLGAWEAYAGLSGRGGDVAVGWMPCAERPCPASVMSRPAGAATWNITPWPVEVFGLDLAVAASGTVAIATRENPNNAGVSLRSVDARALLADRIEGPVQRWNPPAGLSLEDPRLVKGANPPQVLAEAFDLATGRSSGRVFLAEPSGPLREVLQAAASDGNVEVGGCVAAGVLYVAAEPEAGKSGLWRWDGGLRMVGAVEGGYPSVGCAEGAVFVASTAGLWRVEP